MRSEAEEALKPEQQMFPVAGRRRAVVLMGSVLVLEAIKGQK